MMKRAVLLALVLGSSSVLNAQIGATVTASQLERFSNSGIIRMTGGVAISTGENVQIKADEAEYNAKTGEMVLRGTVLLGQKLRPATQTVPATNLAGEPFPAPNEVVMKMGGGVEFVIGDLRIRADEADVNSLTGEMELRGNVRVSHSKWAGSQFFK